jgi:phytoene synthase
MAEPSDRELATDAAVEDAARANALDRYLAARLAPRVARRDLIALAAFVGDTARIAATASEPLIGEIRLQWWRDVLETEGEATGNPVADALREAIARHGLPAEPFAKLLDARSRALDPEFGMSGAALDQHLDETEGAAFRLAARILGVPPGEAADKLLFAAGQSYGRVQLLRTVPLMLEARQRFPRAHLVNDWAELASAILDGARGSLQQVRRNSRAAPESANAAILPTALVEPYLAALERLGPGIVRERADISPLARVWRLWRASVRGTI